MSFRNSGSRLIFLLLMLTLPVTADAQPSWYDITMAGKVIGSVCVLPDDRSGNGFTRTIASTFEVPLVYSGRFESVNRRENGVLITAATQHSSNGKTREKTLTKSSPAGGYHVEFYSSGTRTPARHGALAEIEHTLTDLYYAEPKVVTEAYSERYGVLCAISRIADNRYSVKLPGGKTSVYTYRDGVCRQVELELAGIKLKIVKRDDRQLARNE